MKTFQEFIETDENEETSLEEMVHLSPSERSTYKTVTSPTGSQYHKKSQVGAAHKELLNKGYKYQGKHWYATSAQSHGVTAHTYTHPDTGAKRKIEVVGNHTIRS